MTGKELKKILKQSDVSLSEISRRLGIAPQNLDIYLRSTDVKTGLLERLAEILDKDISWFYSGESFGVTSKSIVSTNTNDISTLLSQITVKDKQIETKDRQIEIKDKQIARLMGIIESMQNISNANIEKKEVV